jgi:hypothetical protein
MARKGVLIALGIICIVLVSGLGGVVAYSALTLSDKNRTIDSLNSQISQLNASTTVLQNEVNDLLLNATPIASISEINLDPSAWVNKTVVVEGQLSGPYMYFTAISYDYVLSSNGTKVAFNDDLGLNSIGVDLGNSIWNGSVNVVIVGTVRQGIIGTIIMGAQPTVIYYIEAESVLS